MEISFGPFLTCFFAIMFLTIYLYIILYRTRNVFAKNTKWLFLGILLIFIRLSVPVNFPFTYSVYSEKFLPRFTNPLCDNKIGNLSIYDCLLILWISVVVIKVLIFFYRKTERGNMRILLLKMRIAGYEGGDHLGGAARRGRTASY